MTDTDKVRFIPSIPTSSGRRRGWLKLVSGIDRSQSGGYAILGEFLSEHEMELPIGGVVVRCSPAGSVKNGYKEYDFGVITSKGRIKYDSRDYTSQNWLTFMDDLEAYCAEHKWTLGDAATDEPVVETVVAPQQFFDDLNTALQRLVVPGIEMESPTFQNHKALVYPQSSVAWPHWAQKVQTGTYMHRLTPAPGFSFVKLGEWHASDGPDTAVYYAAVSENEVFYFQHEPDMYSPKGCRKDEVFYVSANLIPEFIMAEAAKKMGLSMPEPTPAELLHAAEEE